MIQKQQNEVLGHPLPISTYLLKPFQRILKYPELLKVNLFSSHNGWFFRTQRPVFGPRIPKPKNKTRKRPMTWNIVQLSRGKQYKTGHPVTVNYFQSRVGFSKKRPLKMGSAKSQLLWKQ